MALSVLVQIFRDTAKGLLCKLYKMQGRAPRAMLLCKQAGYDSEKQPNMLRLCMRQGREGDSGVTA